MTRELPLSTQFIYQDPGPVARAVRGAFAADVEAAWVDEPLAYEYAREYLEALRPGSGDRVRPCQGAEPLFSRYGIRE
jgi:ribonuclease E